MATQASQRKEYAARSQASNILDGTQQKPGRRLQQQAVSDIFSEEGDPSAKNYDRAAPSLAPFLTDNNAVDTHGRLGGYVNQSDSLVFKAGEMQPYESESYHPTTNANGEIMYVESDGAAEQDAKYCENQNVAQGHKKRNMASNIFGEQDAPTSADPRKAAYDRKNISNVF
ncbi:uncharacterized protein LOC134814857 isoform X3 [Bolinopsis microptera]|uniref:uncharacterized protein LOC134814857 isoform X3 n=1 Tax=Bolinopsis microptera TaxID=2820187 RepID=UPI00307902E7